MELSTILFTVLGAFGIGGTAVFTYLIKSYDELKKEFKDLNVKIKALEKENYCLSHFLDNFLFKFSITASKQSVTIDEEITCLINNSQQELAGIIKFLDNEKLTTKISKNC